VEKKKIVKFFSIFFSSSFFSPIQPFFTNPETVGEYCVSICVSKVGVKSLYNTRYLRVKRLTESYKNKKQ